MRSAMSIAARAVVRSASKWVTENGKLPIRWIELK